MNVKMTYWKYWDENHGQWMMTDNYSKVPAHLKKEAKEIHEQVPMNLAVSKGFNLLDYVNSK